MKQRQADVGLDDLLMLDGIVLVVDPIGPHWVKFVVKRVKSSTERPHGLSYSLSLHGPDNERLVGFDNAHAVPRGSGPSRQASPTHDHRHRGGRSTAYDYRDAMTLLMDFWADVDAVLKRKGALP